MLKLIVLLAVFAGNCPGCVPFYPKDGDVVDALVAQCLVDHGFRGDPDDGQEVIFAPRYFLRMCEDRYPVISA